MDGFDIGSWTASALDYLQTGFDKVNAAQGLAIALVAAILMRSWGQLLLVSFLATLTHAIIDWAVPIVSGVNPIKLPPLVDPAYWQVIAALFVGYVLIVGIFHAAKRGVMSLVRQSGIASSRTSAPAAPPPAGPPPAGGARPTTAGAPPAADKRKH